MTDWRVLASSGDYRQVASELLSAATDWDLSALGRDPMTALRVGGTIQVEVGDPLGEGCGGGGYYRATPPTIYLHPAMWRRDNFTLLHELGHHIQQNHPEWAFTLMDLPPLVRRKTEEAVSHEIATSILMPWDKGSLDAYFAKPAEVMAAMYRESRATRSAVLQRVTGLFPPNAKWILILSDLGGVVQHAVSTYTDAQPKTGSTQPGLAALAAEAMEGPVRRRLTEGIIYSTGNELHDMYAEAILDMEERYLFTALKPESRFGTGRVEFVTFDCGHCGRSFEARWVKRRCESCKEPVCTWCGRCECDPTNTGRSCGRCFEMLTPEEVATGLHECS